MQLHVHFFLINEDFSQEHADTHHDGKESEFNLKYEWEDELLVKEIVQNPSIVRNSEFTLQCQRGEDDYFSYPIENMAVMNIKLTNGFESELACSEEILEKMEWIAEDTVHFYLNQNQFLVNPVAGVYIAANKFPLELIDEEEE